VEVDEQWKPAIRYYDYFVQCTDDVKVKQVFQYVKVRLIYCIIYSNSLGCFDETGIEWSFERLQANCHCF
jgi:hypothetical protein